MHVQLCADLYRIESLPPASWPKMAALVRVELVILPVRRDFNLCYFKVEVSHPSHWNPVAPRREVEQPLLQLRWETQDHVPEAAVRTVSVSRESPTVTGAHVVTAKESVNESLHFHIYVNLADKFVQNKVQVWQITNI